MSTRAVMTFTDRIHTRSEPMANRMTEYPELDSIAHDIANTACWSINSRVANVESAMPYKAQYVLEQAIKILTDRV